MSLVPPVAERTETRTRIIEVATEILRAQGRSALTTRGVAEAAGTQAPTIYRLFGDKDGLLDAVAEHVLATYAAAKGATARAELAGDNDPLADLRSGWQTQIEFGLDNPDLFTLLNDPTRAPRSPAFRDAVAILDARVHRLALAGRLRVSEDKAVLLIRAAGSGAVLTILSMRPEDRDSALADEMFDAVMGRILVDKDLAREGNVLTAVVTVRAASSGLDMLSVAEQRMLTEWLDRAVDHLGRE